MLIIRSPAIVQVTYSCQKSAVRFLKNMNKEIIEAQERLATASFDKAQAYSQVVLSIGYVSIFAAWGFTKEYLTRCETLWSALLACISIIFFVMFDVFTMFMASRSAIQLNKAVAKPELFQEILQQNKDKNIKWTRIYVVVWCFCWPVSFATGIAAAGILIWAFATHLLSGQ